MKQKPIQNAKRSSSAVLGVSVLGAALVIGTGSYCWAQSRRPAPNRPTTSEARTFNQTFSSTGFTTWGSGVVSDGVNTWVRVGDGSMRQLPAKTGPTPTLQQIRLTAKAVPPTALAPAAYLDLAMKIRLDSAATDEARMLDALRRLEIKTYDFNRVDVYLSRKAQEQSAMTYWVWRPMRSVDKEDLHEQASAAGIISTKLYGRAIPARVLETAASVLEKIPDATFFVSDYEVVKPDPFLAVTTKRMLEQDKLWIIDVWAEPGFSDQVPEMKSGPKPIL